MLTKVANKIAFYLFRDGFHFHKFDLSVWRKYSNYFISKRIKIHAP